MSYQEEFSLLEAVRRAKPNDSEKRLPTWNEAVSLQARLVKAMKEVVKLSFESSPNSPAYGVNPYEGLSVHVHKPSTLRFTWAPPEDQPLQIIQPRQGA